MALGSGKQNGHRRFAGGGPRPDRAVAKRDDANVRNEAWRELSPERQLRELDRRLGRGVGAARQRTRLARRAKGAA
jgi:hypothetical protein